ncbi:MAG: 5-formyltetrahydrofolate cyclo-ligase, partial [Dehalococcoidia bacterium]|nr:5-formyltetrahydrofolate cyclo-ligase [Dehalococcoidia bacterium]
RARRDAIPAANREASSTALLARLQALDGFAAAQVVHTYVGVGSEVTTLPLIEQLLEHGIRIACPRVANGNHLEHREIRSTNDLVEGAMKLLEPDPQRCPELPISLIDLVLVPGLAFTRSGHRLGYGRGYYDRLLARSEATAIGLAFDAQLLNELPEETHDRAVDIVITESETIHTGARG